MLTKRMFLKGTVAALASVGSIASAQAKSVAPDTKDVYKRQEQHDEISNHTEDINCLE